MAVGRRCECGYSAWMCGGYTGLRSQAPIPLFLGSCMATEKDDSEGLQRLHFSFCPTHLTPSQARRNNNVSLQVGGILVVMMTQGGGTQTAVPPCPCFCGYRLPGSRAYVPRRLCVGWWGLPEGWDGSQDKSWEGRKLRIPFSSLSYCFSRTVTYQVSMT